MPITPIDINDLASIGVIQDEPGYQMPPEAWTIGNNVRVLDNGMRRLFGWSPIFGSNSVLTGANYVTEDTLSAYVDETGVNNYVTEDAVLVDVDYVTQDGTTVYNTENAAANYITEASSGLGDTIPSGLPMGQAPYFLMFVSSLAHPWWLWGSLTDVFVWDGTQNWNDTKTPKSYHRHDSKDLTGT